MGTNKNSDEMQKKLFEKVSSIPFFQTVSSAYLKTAAKAAVDLNAGMILKNGYACQKYPALVSCFGWEGDKDAPIAYIDGSFLLRDRNNLMVTFGVNNITSKIKWYNKEGFLPCFVSDYQKGKIHYTIENFADCLNIDGEMFVVAYSRMTVRNKGEKRERLPVVSSKLVSLNTIKVNYIDPGHTVIMDFCIGADRFGKKIKYPADNILKSLGGFDRHYKHMREYWLSRLSALVTIEKLPDKRLINAYKAGYIYTMIVKDNYELKVGENGYDRVFDHDIIGILSTLLTLGDFRHFDKYAENILENIQYPDARWKYSWVFAQYLMKTDDGEYVRKCFDSIRENTHTIEAEREDGGKGIMKKTSAIDSGGRWTIDNWSALMGLTSYSYLCDRLGEKEELSWAKEQYDSLLSASNKVLTETAEKYNINYIPIEMTMPNENCARNDPRDANWASMFLFGRWGWDGYLFDAEQSGIMIDRIDDTYSAGFERRKDICDSIYNFGGYPHGYFCSSYNAGYGSAALRGEKYRDMGIKAYIYMIENAQSGPFSWWEGIGYPSDSLPWKISSCCTGAGSCPHMWGQSTATKVLIDSLIAEKSDGTVIIGRGIPNEWIESKEKIQISNFHLSGSKHLGYTLFKQKNKIILNLTGNRAACEKIVLDLMYLKNRIDSADGGDFDNEKGTVIISEGVRHAEIMLK